MLRDYIGSRDSSYFYDDIIDIQTEPELRFRTDPHPNQKGHRAIADNLFQYLTRNKILSYD